MAIARQKLISEVMRLTQHELCQIGMKKRAGNIYTVEVNNDSIGWLGLNRAVRKYEGLLSVNPVIGVRHQSLEQLVAKFCEDKYHPYCPPTISTNIGYLMPQTSYTTWFFSETEDHMVEIKRMVKAVEEYGIPFMNKYRSLNDFVEAMQPSKHGVLDSIIYRLPVTYFILGDIPSANSFLLQELENMEHRDDPASHRYRNFSKNFLEELQKNK